MDTTFLFLLGLTAGVALVIVTLFAVSLLVGRTLAKGLRDRDGILRQSLEHPEPRQEGSARSRDQAGFIALNEIRGCAFCRRVRRFLTKQTSARKT